MAFKFWNAPAPPGLGYALHDYVGAVQESGAAMSTGPALLADERPPGAPPDARVVYEPLGVVLGIMPWNFPFWQVIRAAAPALLGGNTLLLKHAPNVAGCALAIAAVFERAGLPAGVFQVLLTGTAPIPALIADERVRAVTFTGSTGAGRKVAALAGAAMKPGVYELGGSDPYLVLADADLELAAETCAAARLINSGQSCASAKRFIVARPVRRDFERLVTARLAARRTGDPADPTNDVGPLARADLRANLHRQITASIRSGARLLLGGAPLPGPGFFYATTLLTNVRPGMPAADEELFGPAAAILVARDDADAVRLANATPYGLGAAIFTRSARRARELAPSLAKRTTVIVLSDLHAPDAIAALQVLADVDTGYPVLLSELTLTTALRTAAMSALAARWMARRDSRAMALIVAVVDRQMPGAQNSAAQTQTMPRNSPMLRSSSPVSSGDVL